MRPAARCIMQDGLPARSIRGLWALSLSIQGLLRRSKELRKGAFWAANWSECCDRNCKHSSVA